jgi:large conductance mechanosensitive channel
MSLASEFKAFILRGNVVDLAVGLVIGAAFTAIVNAIVANLFTPVLGLLIGGFDFSGLTIPLYKDAKLGIGAVLQAVISFVVVGACLFLVVKGMNKLQKKEEAKPAEPSSTDKLLMEIRDALKNRG